MMVGSLVRFTGSKVNNCRIYKCLTFISHGQWQCGNEAETWYDGEVGLIVDMISSNHRKAIVMRNNKYFEIALKHLEQVSKTSLKRKKDVKETNGQQEEKEQETSR